jgi:hypothetical protein
MHGEIGYLSAGKADVLFLSETRMIMWMSRFWAEYDGVSTSLWQYTGVPRLRRRRRDLAGKTCWHGAWDDFNRHPRLANETCAPIEHGFTLSGYPADFYFSRRRIDQPRCFSLWKVAKIDWALRLLRGSLIHHVSEPPSEDGLQHDSLSAATHRAIARRLPACCGRELARLPQTGDFLHVDDHSVKVVGVASNPPQARMYSRDATRRTRRGG